MQLILWITIRLRRMALRGDLEHWNEEDWEQAVGKNYIARIRQFPFGQATKRRSMPQNIITKPRFR